MYTYFISVTHNVFMVPPESVLVGHASEGPSSAAWSGPSSAASAWRLRGVLWDPFHFTCVFTPGSSTVLTLN